MSETFQRRGCGDKLSFGSICLSLFRGRPITTVGTWCPKAQHERRAVMGPGPLYSDGGTISKKPSEFGEEWRIDIDQVTELPGMVKIVKVLNKSDTKTKKKSLAEKVKETLVIEPIKAFFAITIGLIVAFLLYYLGLKP
jgi:hypothetical protein